MQRLLAFVDPGENGLMALEQAMALAKVDADQPEVLALHQVYDLPAQVEKMMRGSLLKNLTKPIIADAERWLAGAVEPQMGQANAVSKEPIAIKTEVAWGTHCHRAVAVACKDQPIDLVIKRADRGSRWIEFIIHSDDWHLLSHASTEVLMIDEVTHFADGKLLVALESFDPRHETLNRRLLERAVALKETYSLDIHVLHAFPNMTSLPVYGLESAGYLSEEVLAEIEKSHVEATQALVAPYGITPAQITVAPGPAAFLIPEKVSQWQPDCVMLGNLHEKGVPGVALTTSFEQLQESMRCSLWVVPGTE